MKPALLITLIVIGSLLFIFIVLSFITGIVLTKLVAEPKFDSREVRRKSNEANGYLKDTQNYQREDTTFIMRDGYVINGDISIQNPKKFIIFVHGHTSTREGSIKYSRAFNPLGYSMVFYDQRAHGDNVRTYVTMGMNEARDLYDIFKALKERYGQDIEIGIFGVSMGAASALLSTKYTQEMKFIVADCPYASLSDEFVDNVHWKYSPAYLPLLIAKIYAKIKYKLSYKDVNVKKALETNKVPLLLFHGNKDNVVHVKNQKRLLKHIHCYEEHYIFEGAGHAGSCVVDFPRYAKIVKEFLEKVDK